MEVILTKISTHGKNGDTTLRKTKKGHGMYTLVHGSGKNRVSETMHCSEGHAESRKSTVQGQYK